jgi:hypothetical protein
MQFTSEQVRAIARTTDKLATVAHTMWGNSTEDGINALHVAYIIGEMRVCADLMKSEDRATRLAAVDRFTNLIAN